MSKGAKKNWVPFLQAYVNTLQPPPVRHQSPTAKNTGARPEAVGSTLALSDSEPVTYQGAALEFGFLISKMETVSISIS